MGLHPDLEEFRYDLKENTGRRILAGLIDHFMLFIIILIIGGFMTVAMNSMNPLVALVGPLGELLYPYEAYGTQPPSIFLLMITFSVVHLIIYGIYFSFFESSGRRTLGKKLMHLEVLSEEEKYPTMGQAFKRNLLKLIVGMVAVYFLGMIGWAVLIGVAGLVDLKMKPGRKNDVRQRYTEVSSGTMVFLEDEEFPFGTINLPGDKIGKKEEKENSLSGKIRSSVVMARKRGKKKLPDEKKPEMLGPGEGIEEEPEEGSKEDLSLATEEKEEEPEEREENVPFWKKLFGGGKEKEPEEEGPSVTDEVMVEEEPEQLPARSERGRDETVLQFMFDFDINERRAQAIYDMGYRNKAEFKDAIPQDLIMIEGINPTIAKRIVARANE
ncbi:MAG: RDD family protein [Thermoplasmatota archaeon]